MTPPAPNSEDVLIAWVLSVPGMAAAAGADLPDDEQGWAEHGFVQVLTVGGAPSIDVPAARPILQVDCWATTPGSLLPPRRKAGALAEQLVAGMLDHRHAGRTVTTPAGPARVLQVYPVTEPRRVRDDPAGHARVTLDVECDWVRAPDLVGAP